MDDDKLLLALAGFALLAFLGFLVFMHNQSIAPAATAAQQLLVERDAEGRIYSINGQRVR